jgi:hypothetical protein
VKCDGLPVFRLFGRLDLRKQKKNNQNNDRNHNQNNAENDPGTEFFHAALLSIVYQSLKEQTNEGNRMARLRGFEPLTYGSGVRRSIH